jgi:HSP20 family protein
MNAISHWDPFREMLTMRNAMDRLFQSAASENWPETSIWSLALDVVEDEDNYVVKASLPGLNPDDLDITFNNDVLTIKAEIKEEKEVEEKRYHLRERRFGTFMRSLTLPTHINGDAISAAFDSGVLTLTLPKAEEAKPKRIAVTSGARVIEAKTSDIKTKN